MRKKRIKCTILMSIYIAIVIFICYQACLDATKSSLSSGRLIAVLNSTQVYQSLKSKVNNLDMLIRKIVGHFLLFSTLGISSFYAWNNVLKSQKLATTVSLGLGIFWAMATEFIQIFASGRAPAFQDSIIDFQGFLTAILALIILHSLILAFKKRSYSSENLFLCLSTYASSLIFLVLFVFFAEKTDSLVLCNRFFVTVLFCSILVFSLGLLLSPKKEIKDC